MTSTQGKITEGDQRGRIGFLPSNIVQLEQTGQTPTSSNAASVPAAGKPSSEQPSSEIQPVKPKPSWSFKAIGSPTSQRSRTSTSPLAQSSIGPSSSSIDLGPNSAMNVPKNNLNYAKSTSSLNTSSAAVKKAGLNIPVPLGSVPPSKSLADFPFMSQSLSMILTKKNWQDDLTEEQLREYSAEEIKRQQLIWELFATEAAYVQDLSMVVDVSFLLLCTSLICCLS